MHFSLLQKTNLPDFEIFQLVRIDFVNEEVGHLLAKLVEAEKETLHIAELQLGFLVPGILSVLSFFWRQGHELLQDKTSLLSIQYNTLHLYKTLIDKILPLTCQ